MILKLAFEVKSDVAINTYENPALCIIPCVGKITERVIYKNLL